MIKTFLCFQTRISVICYVSSMMTPINRSATARAATCVQLQTQVKFGVRAFFPSLHPSFFAKTYKPQKSNLFSLRGFLGDGEKGV